MPIYQYKCEDCQSHTEVIQSMTAPAPSCSNCNSQNMQKILSPINIGRSPSSQAPAVAVCEEAKQPPKHSSPCQGESSCMGSRASQLIKKYEKSHRVPTVGRS